VLLRKGTFTGWPRLKATVVLGPSGNARLGLLFGGLRHDITFQIGDEIDLVRLLGLLSGVWSPTQIAEFCSFPVADVEAVITRLCAAGLVYVDDPAKAYAHIEVAECIRASEAFFEAIRFDYGRHPLFARLADNERLFIGCAYEYWFLVRDAPVHIALAVLRATGAERTRLDHYLDEEKDHGDEIAPFLAAALNVTTELLFASTPCAAADAALLKTRALASNDLLAYAAATSFCEASIAKSLAMAPGVSSWRPASRALFEALARHFEGDQSAGHASLFAEFMQARAENLTRDAVAGALAAAHLYKHYLDNLNHEILRMYSGEGTVLPRLPPTFGDFEFPLPIT
jgi:hypothetical protein